MRLAGALPRDPAGGAYDAVSDLHIQYSFRELCFAKMNEKLSGCMRGKRLLWACATWEMG